MAQFRQDNSGSSRSIEGCCTSMLLCHEKFYHASLRVKVENSGPGDKSEGHIDLRRVKRKSPEEYTFIELSSSSLSVLVAGLLGKIFLEISMRDFGTDRHNANPHPIASFCACGR